jgi:hypothetical protein
MSNSCAGGVGGKDRLVAAARVAILAQGRLARTGKLMRCNCTRADLRDTVYR